MAVVAALVTLVGVVVVVVELSVVYGGIVG